MRLNKLIPRCHWNKQHGRRRKAKRAFESAYKAGGHIMKHHLEDKYQSYKCDVCGKWHIGHKNDKNLINANSKCN